MSSAYAITASSPAWRSRGQSCSRALTLNMLDAITTELRKAGYQYVTLDTAGFRSGSLNALLPAEVLLRRGA